MSELSDYKPRKKPRTENDEDEPSELPPRPIAMLVGTLGGAAGALVLGLWEANVVVRAGFPLPTGDLLGEALLFQVLFGALFGVALGAARRAGWSFAFPWVLLFGTWLVSGKLALLAGAGGGTWVVLAILLPAAYGLGLAASAQVMPVGLEAGLAGGLFVLIGLILPINQHLLGSAASTLAFVVDGGVLVAALLAGTVVGLFGPAVERLGAAGPLIAAALLGTLGMAPIAMRAEPVWPVATSNEHPPIVLVVIDTLRADHLGAYGYDRPTSPNLDALARRSILYTDATTAAPWTLPSFAGLLTGQVPGRTGAGINTGAGSTLSPLRPDAKLLPAHLADAGYVSAAVVSNPFLTASFGFHRGFDRYDDAPAPAAMPAVLHPLFAMGLDLWPAYRDAGTITDRALEFVAAQDHESWFLMVHYMEVHGPFHPQAEDREAVGTSGKGNLVDDYDASIHLVDRQLGRLLKALPRNAWVFVTSDHGEQLLEKRVHLSKDIPEGTRHGHSMYQEVVHVPLMVSAPGLGARRVDRPVSLLDVTPTILDLVGLPQPDRISGLPLSEITGGYVPDDRDLFCDSVRFGPEQQMVRRGKYKLIRWYGQGAALYDLASEPEEREEVALSDQEMKGLYKRLEGQLAPVGVSAMEPAPPVGAEIQFLLERLGYAAPRHAQPAPAP